MAACNCNEQIEKHWRENGVNYGKTANAWVECMDANKEKIMPVLQDTYGKGNEMKWFMYWRLFHIAVAECFSLNGGNEWIISHYRCVIIRLGATRIEMSSTA